MASTQEHLPISDIKDDLLYLKDGSLAVVLQTSAVNFGLLSENEQLAIISSFAGMLNSLSFMIQIVIRSKKLDISTYLTSLDAAQHKQINPLLYSMISRYKRFIQSTIAENEVLDKQFFIVIPVSYLEVGLTKSADSKKALTLLIPRRDHIIRQLGRIGLKATQLSTEALIKLFYDIYNEEDQTQSEQIELKRSEQAQNPILQQKINPAPPTQIPTAGYIASQPIQPQTPLPNPAQSSQTRVQPVQFTPRRRSPYVVEELPEDYGVAT